SDGAGAVGGHHEGTARLRAGRRARAGPGPRPHRTREAGVAGAAVPGGRGRRRGRARARGAGMSGPPLAGPPAAGPGGSRGMGRAIARRLAGQGAAVVVNYVANEHAAAETVRLIAEAGGRARAVRFDVGDADAVRAGFADVVDHEGRVEILVNNAGLSIDGLLLRLKDDDWNRVLQTNLTGVFHCARAAVRTMIRARYGRIVNLTS